MTRSARTPLTACALIAAVLLVGGGAGATSSGPAAPTSEAVKALTASRSMPHFPADAVGIEAVSRGRLSTGTGIPVAIVGDGAWIATADHVVRGAQHVAVFHPGAAWGHPASRIIENPKEDIALLYVQYMTGLHVLTIGNINALTKQHPIAGEGDCVFAPAWSLQKVPLSVTSADLLTLQGYGTPFLKTGVEKGAQGCSGGPLEAYTYSARGRVLWGMIDSELYHRVPAIGYVPGSEIESLLKKAEK